MYFSPLSINLVRVPIQVLIKWQNQPSFLILQIVTKLGRTKNGGLLILPFNRDLNNVPALVCDRRVDFYAFF